MCGKGIPGRTVCMGRGPEVGKPRACVRSSSEFCLAGVKGVWREWRRVRWEGLECLARWGGEQASLFVSLLTQGARGASSCAVVPLISTHYGLWRRHIK